MYFICSFGLGSLWLCCGFKVARRRNPTGFPRKHQIWRAALVALLFLATISGISAFTIPTIISINDGGPNDWRVDACLEIDIIFWVSDGVLLAAKLSNLWATRHAPQQPPRTQNWDDTAVRAHASHSSGSHWMLTGPSSTPTATLPEEIPLSHLLRGRALSAAAPSPPFPLPPAPPHPIPLPLSLPLPPVLAYFPLPPTNPAFPPNSSPLSRCRSL